LPSAFVPSGDASPPTAATANRAATRVSAAYGTLPEARNAADRGASPMSEVSEEKAAQVSMTSISGGGVGNVSPGAKYVTGVNAPSPPAGPGRARAQQVAMSAANQATLRRGASGEINHPELGRVLVRAQLRAGAVDVEVLADRADTRSVLHASAGVLASDIRDGEVPLGLLSIIDASGSMGGAGSSDRQGAGSGDKSRERSESESGNDENEGPGARMRRQVRIVL